VWWTRATGLFGRLLLFIYFFNFDKRVMPCDLGCLCRVSVLSPRPRARRTGVWSPYRAGAVPPARPGGVNSSRDSDMHDKNQDSNEKPQEILLSVRYCTDTHTHTPYTNSVVTFLPKASVRRARLTAERAPPPHTPPPTPAPRATPCRSK
jgi:hypothetical protein